MNTDQLKSTIKDIKQSFRFYMNGVTAQSLRDKGQPFHLIWGISLLHLHEMAADYPKDADLACALWTENIRECKILATLLMPQDEFPIETARQWAASLVAQEIADCSAQLFAVQPYAEQLAGELATSTNALQAVLAFNIYGRLLTNYDAQTVIQGDAQGKPVDIPSFISKANEALKTDNVNVRYAVIRALQRCANINDCYLNLAKTTLEAHNLDDWLG